MVDYRGLNEVSLPLSAAVPDMLELQPELESKAAKWYTTIDITNAFFSIPLAAECRPQFAFTWRGVQYTWNRLPQGWKHSPTICHGLIQTALEKGEAPEHLQYIDDIIVWGKREADLFEEGKTIIQILLKAGFAIKQRCGLPSWLPGHTLLTPTEPAANQHPQIPFCRAALQPLLSQSMLVSGITPSQVLNLAFVLVKFHAIDDCPMLQSIQIPLQGPSSLERVNSTSQFSIVSKLANGAFNSCIQITDKNIEQNWP
ncbi:macrophage immunometabolism regulator [Grus japonensis]|uniref:ribonuclease H n=1 Tax=Grus japonensis TaxID=30415 RepID=A0ABC9YH92_GRUJA